VRAGSHFSDLHNVTHLVTVVPMGFTFWDTLFIKDYWLQLSATD